MTWSLLFSQKCIDYCILHFNALMLIWNSDESGAEIMFEFYHFSADTRVLWTTLDSLLPLFWTRRKSVNIHGDVCLSKNLGLQPAVYAVKRRQGKVHRFNPADVCR